MLNNRLTIPNILNTHAIAVADPRVPVTDAQNAAGRFATAYQNGDQVVLARDKYGLNKLYFTVDGEQGVLAASYLHELIAAGIALDDIYAAPAGCITMIDMAARSIALRRYYQLAAVAGTAPNPAAALQTARNRLTDWFEALARSGMASVAVCLSGGLDSALIAAFASKYLPNVTAYTYAFDDGSRSLGPDADGASQLASWLGIPHRMVIARADDVLRRVPAALRNGQDWRDFNVHCAIVNELLAEAIAADTPAGHVLTGDLMNEITGDYTPLTYRGQQFYQLPAVPPERLRVSLMRGVQCGDREVGVFAAHRLLVHQPYSAIADDLLAVPARMTKPHIIRALADDLVPDSAYHRPKARAQIGAPEATTGVLPLLVDAGRHGHVLETEFLHAVGAATPQRLGGRIRGGVYQFPHHFPPELS